jgi:hypothetical protein
MTFRIANWNTLDEIFSFQYSRKSILLSVLMASVICLLFNIQEVDVLEHTNGKCHLCVHFSQLVDHCGNICMHLVTLLSMLIPRY